MCRKRPKFGRDVFCGSFDGLECKKGDVCIGGKCYGIDSTATAKYCEYGRPCDSACACADTSFANAIMCSGSNFKCVAGTVKCADGTDPVDGKCKEPVVEDKGGLGAGAIAGIVIAVVVVLAAITIGVFFFLKHRKQEEETDQKEKDENDVQVAAE